ncbi:DDE-type integrase/transposase/recombinase [Bacillus thuringiensis serovar andalousiensis]|uniref:DDE-type integrase/transposase/recombinase n=1 Tax=Bacillus thuringiensis serovar andalousiensis TaxID=257985 RepID=A0A858MWC2_BACTU|nr:DDE-type integrase/transposase/recombinase [Bacillus thuringiensis serovar andalousiensis]
MINAKKHLGSAWFWCKVFASGPSIILELDETYIKVKGEQRYLYRVIDKNEHKLEIYNFTKKGLSGGICLYKKTSKNT